MITGCGIKLLRAEWFEVISDKWYPLEEDIAQQIEEAHKSTAWRTKVNYCGGPFRVFYMEVFFSVMSSLSDK